MENPNGDEGGNPFHDPHAYDPNAASSSNPTFWRPDSSSSHSSFTQHTYNNPYDSSHGSPYIGSPRGPPPVPPFIHTPPSTYTGRATQASVANMDDVRDIHGAYYDPRVPPHYYPQRPPFPPPPALGYAPAYRVSGVIRGNAPIAPIYPIQGVNQMDVNNPGKTMKDYLQPDMDSEPSCIILPYNAGTFTFRSGMINHLPTFHGMDNEQAYLHIREFLDMVATFEHQNCSEDVLRLRLFPFSLKDKAKIWLHQLRPGSISTWLEMKEQFLKKYFPVHRTITLRNAISNFSQKENEPFDKCWERFKEMLGACPHHAFEPWRLVTFFHSRLSPESKQLVASLCTGEFISLLPDEALAHFEYVAETAQSWDTSDPHDRTIKAKVFSTQNAPSHGLFHLSEEDGMNAKVAQLTRRVEEMSLKAPQETPPQPLVEAICAICETIGHPTQECPTIPAFKEMLNEQVNAMGVYKKPYNSPYSETYNPGWKNHPNFGWRNENPQSHPPKQNQAHPPFPQSFPQQYQHPPPPQYQQPQVQVPHHQGPPGFQGAPPQNQFPPQQRRNYEETNQGLAQRLSAQEQMTSQMFQMMTDMKISLHQLANPPPNVEKGKLPAQPQPNPKGTMSIETLVPKDTKIEEAKAVTTLRSGRVVDNLVQMPTPTPNSEQNPIVDGEPLVGDNSPPLIEESEIPTVREELPQAPGSSCPIPPPFPQRIKAKENNPKAQEFLELFKQVKLNIPLLDAIKQIPAYAKFLKDLCTIKRKLNVKKKAYMAAHASSIILNNTPPKFKDPGCPTIACVIGEHHIDRALLDLGASVNLLPYSVYLQLGLSELKDTRVTLQLADRSVKRPRGMVSDVIVQVGNFYYPVDFIVLDTQPVEKGSSQIPIILGRPFLATVNAQINCRNGLMSLSFGNMKVEVNVFSLMKQPNLENDEDDEEICEVACIDTLVQDWFDMSHFQDPLEACISNSLESKFLLDNTCDNDLQNETCFSIDNAWIDACFALESCEEISGENVSENNVDACVEDAMWATNFEKLPPRDSFPLPSNVSMPNLELKPLPKDLKYAFLGGENTFPVVISAKLDLGQEERLLEVLRRNKSAIGWCIADLKGISPKFCTHKIFLEENAKPRRQMQRRLNPKMKEVVM